MSKELANKKAFLEKLKKSRALSAKPTRATADRIRERAAQSSKKRLLFAIDATASREAAWGVATEITSSMFEAVPEEIEVALAYHSAGQVQEVTPFVKSARPFLDKLHQVRCSAGGTKLNGIMAEALELSGLACCVYIGDCFEECETEALDLARQLKLKGVKTFIFHDKTSAGAGYSVDSAGEIFSKIADITGGAVLDFNDQAPKQAEELLVGVALYAAGGKRLLEKKRGELPGAAKLLEHLQ